MLSEYDLSSSWIVQLFPLQNFLQLHWNREYITSLIVSHFPLLISDTVPYNFISGPANVLISFCCMLSPYLHWSLPELLGKNLLISHIIIIIFIINSWSLFSYKFCKSYFLWSILRHIFHQKRKSILNILKSNLPLRSRIKLVSYFRSERTSLHEFQLSATKPTKLSLF